MGTTGKGLRFPEPEDRLNQANVHIANLAADVNTRLAVQPMFSEAAMTAVITVPNGAKNASATVNYPSSRFTQPPVTVAQVGFSSAGAMVGATVLLTANSTTSCTVRVELAATAAAATNVPVQLIARQALSGSATG